MTGSWDAVATLIDPSRRALYDYVRRQDRPVRRDEAAAATGMSRGLAAFHLDKLVATGLLAARYEALAGPRGRGRAPKVYVATGEGLEITIPERRYELLAGILAEAYAEGVEPDRVAGRRGHDLGARLHSADGGVVPALADLGFEPDTTGGPVVLRNCPFRALAARHTALVCGLNLAFVTGMLEGLGAGGVDAELAPRPGRCCVRLRVPAGLVPRTAQEGDVVPPLHSGPDAAAPARALTQGPPTTPGEGSRPGSPAG